jgi:uncharacterized secreted repeat protein (TIGR03808 family)
MLNRRLFIAGLAATTVATPAGAVEATKYGVESGKTEDQSARLQDAMLKAAAEGRQLFLGAGTYFVSNLQVPSGLDLAGIAGATILAASGVAPVASISGAAGVRLSGLTFSAGTDGPDGDAEALLMISASSGIRLADLGLAGGRSNGIAITDAEADVTGCRFVDHARAAIFSRDSRGLSISGNRISNCGNGGILVWGSTPRRDGSVIRGNIISGIGATAGGNGQNGNGINLFRVNDVVVADNQIAQCAFTAIRLNATTDVAVTGNLCRESGEVAIFSEFGFSGSVIADNVIDDAATGISITNLDSGGRLATCSGNIVRNIRARSEVNPDTRPVGIYVEADTAVSGNAVDTVPGIGILAGNGPFVRNIAITGNSVTGAETGIAITTERDETTGKVLVANNLISGAATPLAGRAWDRVTSTDLARDAAKFPNITLIGNVAG